MKLEALNDFRKKSAEALKNIEYFCSEKGYFELVKTLDLREKDPHHQPPKRDYSLGFVTNVSIRKFMELTREKAKLLEESFWGLDKAYQVITIYLTKEEQKVLEKFMEEMRRHEHFISGSIKNLSEGNEVRLLVNFISNSSMIYKDGYEKIKGFEVEAEKVLVKHSFPDIVKKLEK